MSIERYIVLYLLVAALKHVCTTRLGLYRKAGIEVEYVMKSEDLASMRCVLVETKKMLSSWTPSIFNASFSAATTNLPVERLAISQLFFSSLNPLVLAPKNSLALTYSVISGNAGGNPFVLSFVPK